MGVHGRFGFVLLVIVVCASSAAAQTHLARPASDLVTLEVAGGLIAGCGPAKLDFIRVLPDGKSSGLFRVPAGQVLVVTDVDWQFAHPTAGGRFQILRLFIENLADPAEKRRVFESTIALSSTGEGGASESMTSGFVVSSAAKLCADVFPGPLGPPSGLQHLIVRGYLTSEGRF